MPSLPLDHVTIAGSNLDALRRAFLDVGLASAYGGVHSNGVTHMASLGFGDGSYVELISTVARDTESPWWPRQIAMNGGPCGWCARADDMTGEVERLKSLGVPVSGPQRYERVRPDGTRIEWDLAFPGQGMGAVLPFLIQDRTPRERRVQVTGGIGETSITGVAQVVIAVRDLAWNTELFERLYGWTRRVTRPDPAMGLTAVHFTGTPVTLAAPLGSASWLQERLAQFGDSPAALLLATTDLQATAARLPAATPGSWLNRRALWFDRDRLHGIYLGIIQEAA